MPPRQTGTEPHGVMHRYREIPTPRDRFWADPFIARDEGRLSEALAHLQAATNAEPAYLPAWHA